MAKILVYHVKDQEAPNGRSMLSEIGWGSIPINFHLNHEQVAAVTTEKTGIEALDEAYRLTQNINHPWTKNAQVEIKAPAGRSSFRSTHIADVLIMGGDAYVCEAYGWAKIETWDQKVVRG